MSDLNSLSMEELRKLVKQKQDKLCPAYSKMTRDELIKYLFEPPTD